MVSDLSAWLAQPDANHGWILLGDETITGTTRRFDSRESDSPGDRPTLTIWYSLDPSPVSHTTWGALKSLYH
jgi:hypothetical protein